MRLSATDRKQCLETTHVMIEAVNYVGCDAYLAAQKEDCICQRFSNHDEL